MNGPRHDRQFGVPSCRDLLGVASTAMFVIAFGALSGASGAPLQHTLPPLPYAADALEPVISANTISYHYGKHHKAYIDNLNKLIAETPLAGMPLEKIVIETAGKPDRIAIFNNAAQAWNHEFFWQSLAPNGG
jgi:Fe-Mn family superoxide dismutase